MEYYPVMLDIRDRRCVVVGGGDVAERKVLSLLEAGASVVVISPTLTDRLRKLADKGEIDHIARPYRKGDLKGAFLAIVATDDEVVNRTASEEAQQAGIPVNVVDRPELCSFIVPAVVRRGSLLVAISTSGASPAMAALLKGLISEAIPEGIEEVLEVLKDKRKEVLQKVHDPATRKAIFEEAVSRQMIELLRREGPLRAIRFIEEVIDTGG